jgi:hypothetical protein
MVKSNKDSSSDTLKVKTKKYRQLLSIPPCSVADPGCLSRIMDSGSKFFIPDPGSKKSNRRKRKEKDFLFYLFVATNITKLKIILFLNR